MASCVPSTLDNLQNVGFHGARWLLLPEVPHLGGFLLAAGPVTCATAYVLAVRCIAACVRPASRACWADRLRPRSWPLDGLALMLPPPRGACCCCGRAQVLGMMDKAPVVDPVAVQAAAAAKAGGSKL